MLQASCGCPYTAVSFGKKYGHALAPPELARYEIIP